MERKSRIVPIVFVTLVPLLALSAVAWLWTESNRDPDMRAGFARNIYDTGNTNGATVPSAIDAQLSNSIAGRVLVTTYPGGLWGSPLTFYVIDPERLETPVATIRSTLSRNTASSFQLIGNQIFFYSTEARTINWLDFDGNVHATGAKARQASRSFAVSPDGQNLAWAEAQGDGTEFESTVVLSNIQGEKERMLFSKHFDSERFLSVVKWSADGTSIYVADNIGGIGGYIIFGGDQKISKIDVASGGVTDVFGGESWSPYVTDIADNGSILIYFGTGNRPFMGIKNLVTGEAREVPIPIEEGFHGGGDGKLSPDLRKVVYSIAHWNFEDEYYKTLVVDVTGQNQRVVWEDPEGASRALGWIGNDKLLRSDGKSIELVDLEGRVVSEYP